MDNKRQSRLWDEEERLIKEIANLEFELKEAKDQLVIVQEDLREEEAWIKEQESMEIR